MKIHLVEKMGYAGTWLRHKTLCGLKARGLKTVLVVTSAKRANGPLCNNCTRIKRSVARRKRMRQ